MSSRICVFSDFESASTAILFPLLQHYGLQPELVSSTASDQSNLSDYSAVFVSARWLEMQIGLSEFCSVLLATDTPVLIYDITETSSTSSLLDQVHCPYLVNTVHSTSIKWSICAVSGSLSGLSSDFQSRSYCFTNTDDDWESLISLDGQGIFLRRRIGNTDLFLLAGASLGSIDPAVTSAAEETDLLIRLSPIILFLKETIGDCLWHTENRMGCFIIDDPPLWKKYGFHSLDKLRDALSSRGSASIALIPWYYRKSTKNLLKLFEKVFRR